MAWVGGRPPPSGPGAAEGFAYLSAARPARTGERFANMSNELWRSALESLRRRFESGAQKHPGLRCVLIQVGPDHFSKLHANPVSVPTGTRINGGYHIYSKIGGAARLVRRDAAIIETVRVQPNDHTLRRHYFIGDQAAVSLFCAAATDAGRTLAALPLSACDTISENTRRCGNEHARWIWTLFELAGRPCPARP